MRRVIVLFALLTPAAAWADYYPYVIKGPVISGVSQTDAWVAWSTAHHEGASGFNECSSDAISGTPNTDIPTLTLSPGGSTFQDSNCSRDHKVHLTGLAPGTKYTFTLDKPFDDQTAVAGTFVTAPATNDAVFSFVVYGDNRDNPFPESSTKADHQAVSTAIMTNEPDAAFLLHTGDLALNIPAVSGDDNGYTEFFDVERLLLQSRGIYTAIGNHETMDTTEYDTLVNANGFAQSPHPYYFSMDWGQVHVAFLDAFEGTHGLTGNAPAISDEQVNWLDGDLAAAQAAGQLLFIVAHQGPFSHSNDSSAHGGSPDFQSKVVPLMLKYGVLASFAGHDHYYQRGHEGCIDYFVVGGGGAAQYDPDPTAAGVAVAQKRISYLVVNVNGNSVSAQAKATDGTIFDTFDFTPASQDACNGTPDAGPGPVDMDAGFVDAGALDAGSAVLVDAGVPEGVDAHPMDDADAGQPVSQGGSVDAGSGAEQLTKPGCGCQGASAAWPLLVIAALFVARRRARA